MAYNIQIIQARDFVRATPQGTLDFEQSKKLLFEISSAARGLSNYAILVGIRRAESELSVKEIWDLAEQIYQLDKKHYLQQRLCVLPHHCNFLRRRQFKL